MFSSPGSHAHGNVPRTHAPPRARPACGALLAIALLAGCQSYVEAPLALDAHATAVDGRMNSLEPVSAFAERLRHAGADVPDRFDPADGLTAAEGEVLALFYNPDLRLARMEAGVALANLETAGLWEDPEFGFDADQILSPSSLFEWGLGLNLTIPVSGRLKVEKERAGAAYEVTLRQIVAAEWSTRAAVRRAWSAWSVAREQARLLQQVVREVQELESITSQMESTGDLTRIEARLFRVELADRMAALTEAELEATRARLELLGLMGLAPDAPVRLVDSLRTPTLRAAGDPITRIIEANAALAVRRAEYQVAEQTLRLEIRKQFPDITIGSGYGSEDKDSRLLFGVSFPVPVLNANRAGIAEAQALRDTARAIVETTFERLARDHAAATAMLEAARSQRNQFETEVVPMMARQARETVEIAQLGDVDTLLLLETVTRQFEAKSRLLELRHAEVDAVNQISELLGPAPGALPSPRETETPATGDRR